MKRAGLAIGWLGAALILAAGCTKSTPRVVQAQPAPRHVVMAWINVTSGCQQPTVDLINRLAGQYKDTVEVEIVDFGSPEGNRRWREAGLDCMTIQFDGADAVTFPTAQGPKTVIFRMPAGFLWTHDDLVAAFKALAEGKLRRATEEEIRRLLAPRKISMKIEARAAKDKKTGKTIGQLVIDGDVIAELHGTAAGKGPVERAKKAKAALEKWIQKPVLPSDLSIAKSRQGWGVYANQTLVLLVSEADAKALGLKARQVANLWLAGIRAKAIAAARKAAEKEMQRRNESAANQATGQ